MSNVPLPLSLRQKMLNDLAENVGYEWGKPVWATLLDMDGNELPVTRKVCKFIGVIDAKATWEEVKLRLPADYEDDTVRLAIIFQLGGEVYPAIDFYVGQEKVIRAAPNMAVT